MTTTTEVIADKVSSVATYGGSGTAIAFGLSASEWQAVGVVGGLFAAVIGILINWWFKREHLRIAQRNGMADRDE